MASLSTHVLDLAAGVPAAGVRVELASLSGGEPAGSGVTGADGRIGELGVGLGPGA
jgi:5-hydroxyisourate hydrolase